MLFWFITISVLGLKGVVTTLGVTRLEPPRWSSFHHRKWMGGFFVLGSVFLAVTGAEALRRHGTFRSETHPAGLVQHRFPRPAAQLFRPGALLLHDPTAVVNPFTGWRQSGQFFRWSSWRHSRRLLPHRPSFRCLLLTMQAIQLGYCPRLEINHTSSMERGQVYVPYVNWG
jgi:KUP system potassium uptake protein